MNILATRIGLPINFIILAKSEKRYLPEAYTSICAGDPNGVAKLDERLPFVITEC